jgi:hypothetical protein
MDSRAARRAAEKAARNLMNERAALVGELGVMDAERRRLADEVAAAARRGRQLVADAEAEAARLVAAAQDVAQDGEQRYADVYGAATAEGWAPGDLKALGFAPSSNNPPRRRRSTPLPAETNQPPLTLPAQPAPDPGEHESVPDPAAVTS